MNVGASGMIPSSKTRTFMWSSNDTKDFSTKDSFRSFLRKVLMKSFLGSFNQGSFSGICFFRELTFYGDRVSTFQDISGYKWIWGFQGTGKTICSDLIFLVAMFPRIWASRELSGKLSHKNHALETLFGSRAPADFVPRIPFNLATTDSPNQGRNCTWPFITLPFNEPIAELKLFTLKNWLP